MSSVNKVILIGNLGADPEIRYTQNNICVATISMATTETWIDKGERRERTDWHRVVVWGRRAEVCQQFLGKGSKVYIEGQLQTRKWQDKDGADRYTTEVKAVDVVFLGSASAQASASPSREGEKESGREGEGVKPTRKPAGVTQDQLDDVDDDLPF